jgi:hypothetical protein
MSSKLSMEIFAPARPWRGARRNAAVISSSELDPIPADRPPVKLLKYDRLHWPQPYAWR